MKKFFSKIYDFFASPVFAYTFLRMTKVTLFLLALMIVGPWVWVNKLDPAITQGSSYPEFVCAFILCLFVVNNILNPQKPRSQNESWFIEVDE
jgi:hypothetical protein